MASGSCSKKMKVVAVPIIIPDDVKGEIIAFLPVKKAFNLGLTSLRFSDDWKYCRDLSFDIDYRTLANPANIFEIVKKVMDEHRGPVIERLKIIVNPWGNEDQVHDWIRKAIAKGLQELNLDFSSGILRFVFPPNILDGARLNVLKVCYCELDSLLQFDSLRYLKTLSVEEVFFPCYFSYALFSNCLLLENLEITKSFLELYLPIDAFKLQNFKSLKVIRCSNLRQLYITAPSLQVFHYIGEICLIHPTLGLPKIEEVVLHFNESRRMINSIPGMEVFLFSINQTKFLSVSSIIVEMFCTMNFKFKYSALSFGFHNLNELRLSLFGQKIPLLLPSRDLDPSDIGCFLRKIPCIEKLTIDFGVFPMVSGPYNRELVAKHQFQNYTTYFNFLKSICFINFKFFNLEMQLANFIIASANSLKQCIIVKTKDYPGATKEELDFINSMAAKSFRTTTYLHNQFTSY